MLFELAAYTILSVMNMSADISDTQLLTPLPKTSPSPTPTPLPTSTPTPLPTATQTPTPTPTPLPIIAPSDIDILFTKYASLYQVDNELVKKIAKCESGFNSEAENGSYVGMFQFAEQTWIAVRNRMGENTDTSLRKNTEEAIKTASFYISQGGQRAWANCL